MLKSILPRSGIIFSGEVNVTIHKVLEEAVAAQQAGKYSDAVRLYGIVLGEQPGNAIANYNLGVLSVEIESLPTALTLFRNAIDSNRGEKQYWVSYIDALLKDGQLEKADCAAKEALENGISVMQNLS